MHFYITIFVYYPPPITFVTSKKIHRNVFSHNITCLTPHMITMKYKLINPNTLYMMGLTSLL